MLLRTYETHVLQAAGNLQEFFLPKMHFFFNQKNKKEKKGFFDLFLKQQATCKGPPVARLVSKEHTSAYVSIRQHTSAYVSIRQHNLQGPPVARLVS
jgi:hypothetical protein